MTAAADCRRPTLTSRRNRLARWPGGLALVALCAALHLPGLFTLPPIDRDEPRFAQASRQMLHGDTLADWIVPRVQDTPRLKKPPLIYWLQASSAAIFGDENVRNPDDSAAAPPLTGRIWVYRVPSALCALLAVLVTWRIGLSMFAPPAAWLAGALLAASWLVMVDARLARADQLLLAMTTLTQGALWHIWRRAERGRPVGIGWPLAFWIGLGLGILAKGPVTPAIAVLTVLALSASRAIQSKIQNPKSKILRFGWLRQLRLALGLLIAAALVIPWLLLVANAVGWQTLLDIIADEVLARSTSVKEGHWGPPGYHAVAMLLLFWPGSLLAVAALQRGWKTARRGRPAERFLLAWLVPAWIVFELIMTKLPHYVLPLYPALALLSARSAFAIASRRFEIPSNWISRAGLGLWLTLGILGAVVAPLALSLGLNGALSAAGGMALVAGALAACALLCGATYLFARVRPVAALGFGLAVAVISSIVTFAIVLPRCDALWVPSQAAAAIRAHDPNVDRPLAAVKYWEDSLVYLSHGRVQRVAPEDLSAWFTVNAGGLALLDAQLEAADVRELAHLQGFNYSAGNWVELRLVERASE